MDCDHRNIRFTLTPELKHHGREDCVDCHRFVRWVAKPETLERQSRNAEHLVALRKMERLSDWERSFIESLEGQGPKFSPRQQEKLDQIWEKYAPR